MPPKVKGTQSNSSAKGKQTNSSPSASGTATPVTRDEVDSKAASTGRVSRPDKAAYDAEQNGIKKEIEALEVKLSAVQSKISSFSSSGGKNPRKEELRAELDSIRQEQSKSKQSREKVHEQLNAFNESVQKKAKDLQASRGKSQFRSVADVDAHIKHLDKQVESGAMKLADEKRALQEISQCKRTRRIVEGFQAQQDAIDKERAEADQLRALLDDPTWKATNARYDAIKKELDEIKKDDDEHYANRNKLYDERNELKRQLDEFYAKKRESAQNYKAENDKYWAKVHADRAKMAERARAQRAADEEAKKQQQADRLREEASAPAFQSQIEDCQTLVDYFSGKSGGTISLSTSSQPLSAKQEIIGVPKLELRKVDSDFGDGFVVRKKKGEEEDSYFVASKGKGKNRKGGAATKPANGNGNANTDSAVVETDASSGGANFNAPLPILSALLSLSIPPPTSKAEVPRVIDDLKTKKAWYEANQARVTAENVAKAEATISKLHKGKQGDAPPPNGDGENPAEPAPTPAAADKLAVGVPSDAVDGQLEEVENSQVAIEA